jgi:hypothetical protein
MADVPIRHLPETGLFRHNFDRRAHRVGRSSFGNIIDRKTQWNDSLAIARIILGKVTSHAWL